MFKLILIVAFFLSVVSGKSILSSFTHNSEKCIMAHPVGLWDGFLIRNDFTNDFVIGVNDQDTFITVNSPLIISIPFYEIEKTIQKHGYRIALIIQVVPFQSTKMQNVSTIEIKLLDKNTFGKNSKYNIFYEKKFKIPSWSEGGPLDIDLEWFREGAKIHDVKSLKLVIQGINGMEIITSTCVKNKENSDYLSPFILACP